MNRSDFSDKLREYLGAQSTYLQKVTLQSRLWAGLVNDIYWPVGMAQVRERLKHELYK